MPEEKKKKIKSVEPTGRPSDWFYEVKNRVRHPSKIIEETFGIKPKKEEEIKPVKKIAKQRPPESEV